MPLGIPTNLPLSGAELMQLKHHAERSFETVMNTFQHPEEALIRALWNAESYLDRWPFRDVKPPIDLEYGLLVVEVFMPHHVLEILDVLRLSDDMMAN